ncbi:MAG: hypothetical protein ACTSX2_00020 [Candidatus Thorarchaeota archaeon]
MNKLQYACDMSIIWANLHSSTMTLQIMTGGNMNNFMMGSLIDACDRATDVLGDILDDLSEEDAQRVADMKGVILADLAQKYGDRATANLFRQDLPDISDIFKGGDDD